MKRFVLKNALRKIIYPFTLLLLLGITVCCVTATARGQENMELAEKERFYQEQERELLGDMKQELAQKGFVGSGVTLNRVVVGDTERTYTFTIHHSRIDAMAPADRERLAEQLMAVTESFLCAAPEDSCEFGCRFLIR